MAKQILTPNTTVVTNVQALPDVVIGDSANLKLTFDKTGSDLKDYINSTLVPQLNGDSGSTRIGHDSTNYSSDNVGDALEEIYQKAQETVPYIEVEAARVSSANESFPTLKARLDAHETAEKPHLMSVEGVNYRYGLKQSGGFVQFIYEEVL